MAVRIIVDSTADMPAEHKKRCYVVPLTVHFGNEEYMDGVTIDHKTFYEKLIESGEMFIVSVVGMGSAYEYFAVKELELVKTK